MPGIQITDTYDALLATTLRNYSRKLRDNIFNAFPMLKWLRSKGRVNTINGGYQIVEHVLYGKNTTVASYSGYGTLDTTPQEGLTIGYFDWKEYGGTIAISRREKRQNSGEHQLISLLQAKTQQAELSMQDKLTTDLFANLSSEPSTAVTPIPLIISNSPSTTTVGGISGSTYGWWRNYAASVGAYAANLEDKLRIGFNSCSAGGGNFPDAILCSQGAYQYYESLGPTLKRFVNETATLDLGFEVLRYKGADMFWDAGLPTNVPSTGETIYYLNSRNIRLCVDSQSDFVTTSAIEPENQTAFVSKLLAMLNLTCNNRRMLGVLYGITA